MFFNECILAIHICYEIIWMSVGQALLQFTVGRRSIRVRVHVVAES